MAPVASQSVVAGRTILTAASESGSTVIVQPMLLPFTCRFASFTVPPSTVKAWYRRVLKLSLNSSLNRIWKVNASVPLWLSGLDSRLTVSSDGAATTSPVAALVSVFFVARVVGKAHLHLDGLALVGVNQGCSWFRGVLDVRVRSCRRSVSTGSCTNRWSTRRCPRCRMCWPSGSPPPAPSR